MCTIKRSNRVFKFMLYLLVMPYIVTMLWSGNVGKSELASQGTILPRESGIMINLEDGHGKLTMSMEEYLCGALPLVIPVVYEPQTLEAQAILLRTEIIRMFRMEREKGKDNLALPRSTYLSQIQLMDLWDVHYQEYQQKIRQAVSSTGGIYLTFRGLPIQACFFRVSAGSTRDGTKLMDGQFPYLVSAECPKDYLAEEFLTKLFYSKKQLAELLGGTLRDLQFDSSGYVNLVCVESKEENTEIYYYSEEWLRQKLRLQSSHITMEENGKEAVLVVKGMGHGYGMSQFAANEMAKEGANHRVILSYFFQNITFDKYE